MSAPPETEAPHTPREEPHVAKSVRMSVINEDGPPSPSVVKPEITEEVLEVKIEYTQQVKVEQQPAPVPKSAASAAASAPPSDLCLASIL